MGFFGDPEYERRFSGTVRKHRERLGLSLNDLGRLIGYQDGGGISSVEKGTADPTLSKFLKMCEVLGPDFVDDVYDEMFKIAKEGLAHKRDEHITIAAGYGNEIRHRQKKARPS